MQPASLKKNLQLHKKKKSPNLQENYKAGNTAAAEPSTNACVADRNLCNDPSVYIATTA